ncbi:MAG: NUDIX hydrolase [Gammaproteobacteria bacterium]|nr:NUDIX hydrolase [Gammaproteobacteria bacterium]
MIPKEPKPAATVVLVRESRDDIEVLMLLRDRNLAFNASSWVFPGGKIDPRDYHPDHSDKQALEYRAARRAAVRETHEEAGIELVHEHLIHTAHWTTPEHLPLRYSTWFFLCPIYHPVEVTVDDCEIRDYRWIRPATALTEIESRQLKVPHPTRVTLRDLLEYSTIEQVLAGIAQQDIRVFPENSPHYRPSEMGVQDVPIK